MDTIQANVTGKKIGAAADNLAHPGSPCGPPLTITIRRAQELSGLSRSSINRLMWSGKLRSSTVGSRRLIEFASFIEVLGLNRSDAA
jgi:hypothetical protein